MNEKMKKRIFDMIFIGITAIILIVLNEFGLLEKFVPFLIIPILFAYKLGQYAERKFKVE